MSVTLILQILLTPAAEITLNKIPEIQVFQRITVAAKVINLSEPISVASGKRKQDVIISDCTNTTRLTVWEEDIGTLHVNNSYRCENVVVREFNQRRYLSKAKHRSTITQIDNIGDVEDFSDSDTQDDHQQIHDPTLVAVPRLDSYQACMHCKVPMAHPLGRCSKCSLMQRSDKCVEQLRIDLPSL